MDSTGRGTVLSVPSKTLMQREVASNVERRLMLRRGEGKGVFIADDLFQLALPDNKLLDRDNSFPTDES